MKKTAGKRLLLSPEKVRNLTPNQLGQVAGGQPTTSDSWCTNGSCHYPSGDSKCQSDGG